MKAKVLAEFSHRETSALLRHRLIENLRDQQIEQLILLIRVLDPQSFADGTRYRSHLGERHRTGSYGVEAMCSQNGREHSKKPVPIDAFAHSCTLPVSRPTFRAR